MAKDYTDNHEGAYLGKLESIQFGKRGEYSVISLNFRLTHDVRNGEWDNAIESVNITVPVVRFLSGKSEYYTIRDLRSMGFNNSISDPKVDARYYTESVPLTCVHKQKGDKINEQWEMDEFKTEGGSTLTPLDSSEAANLLAKFTAATPPKGAPPPPPPAPKAPSPPPRITTGVQSGDDAGEPVGAAKGKDDLPF